MHHPPTDADHPRPGRAKWSAWSKFCLWLAISPLLLLLIAQPLFWLLGCAGNEGAGLRCAHAPWFSEAATTTMLLGAFGIAYTLPAALVLLLLGRVVRSRQRSRSRP